MDVNHTSVIAVMRLDGDIRRRVFIYEADEKCVHIAYLSTRIKDFKGHAYFVPLRRKYWPIRNEIANQLIDLSGTPYDYKSLFTNAIKRSELNSDELYCSETAQYAIKESVSEDEFKEHMKLAGLHSKIGDRDVYYGARPGEFQLLGFHGESIKVF